MQTLTSSGKVGLGTDSVDVVFFPSVSPVSFFTAEDMEREVFPLQTEGLQSWRLKDPHWPHRKPGKDKGSTDYTLIEV